MKKIILLLLFTLNLFSYSKIIDTKIQNNIIYNIVETEATVMNNYTEGEKKKSICMVFYNRKNKIAVSQVFYDVYKFKIDDKIKIYYVEDSKKSKQSFDVFFQKKDIQLPLVENKVITIKTTTKSIPTNSCHSFYSSTPFYFLEKLKNNQGYQYSFSESKIYIFIKVLLILFIIFSIIKINIGAGIIALIMFIALSSFQTHMGAEKLIFDTKKNAFYQQYEEKENNIEIVNYTPFKNIKALQVLTYEECTTNSRDYEECIEAYELNLVLNNNNRINLETHTNYELISHHLTILENLLNIQVFYHEDNK